MQTQHDIYNSIAYVLDYSYLTTDPPSDFNMVGEPILFYQKEEFYWLKAKALWNHR